MPTHRRRRLRQSRKSIAASAALCRPPSLPDNPPRRPACSPTSSNGGMVMPVPCKFERSLLSHEEYETIRLTHHPAIYDLEVAELEAMRTRLRKMRDKERTLGRQRQRERRGKAEARGASFLGTAGRASERKQVFAAALKRLNKERGRRQYLVARIAHV